MKVQSLNLVAQRTLDGPVEFAACRDRFFASPIADAVLPWCMPELSTQGFANRAAAIQCTEDFQHALVDPALKKVLNSSSQGLTISGLDRLPADRKFLFIANHRCIVTDAALVSLTLLRSGRGTCKVCLGDNLMVKPGVAELLLMVNGVVIKRTGSHKDVYEAARDVAGYLAQQIDNNRYSIWLSQSPGRTKDGNDHTDPAIIKMLSLGCGRTHADFEKLHIVPVAVSYEYEPCAVEKVRETLMRNTHGTYVKTAEEDLQQIKSSVAGQKGRVHLAFGQELTLADATSEDVIQDVVDQIDSQIWQMYRTWPSNEVADAALQHRSEALTSPYAQSFLSMLDTQVHDLQQMGMVPHAARQALLQLYARPMANARRTHSLAGQT